MGAGWYSNVCCQAVMAACAILEGIIVSHNGGCGDGAWLWGWCMVVGMVYGCGDGVWLWGWCVVVGMVRGCGDGVWLWGWCAVVVTVWELCMVVGIVRVCGDGAWLWDGREWEDGCMRMHCLGYVVAVAKTDR